MALWPFLAAIIVVLIAFWYYCKNQYDYFEKRGIPYMKPFPVLGSVWKAVLQRVTFAESVREIYNLHPDAKYVGFFEFMMPVVTIRDIELLKSITVKNFEHFQDHQNFQGEGVEPLFERNLFALRGERWKEMRTMLSPAFTSSKMKAMFILMRECASRYGDSLSSLPAEKRILELKDAFTRYTNDVIATCAFGVSVDSLNDRQNKFYVYGRESTNFGRLQSLKFFILRHLPTVAKLFKIRIVREEIVNFFRDLVEDTIKTRDEKGIVRPDMIQLMMETRGKMGPGKELTIEDMTAQAFIFFFGGFESTSTLMCFAAYELGVNQDVQQKLQEEIDEVLEKCNGEVTYEAINEMKYLDAIINESLRMYPVVVAVDRLCTKDFELPPALPGLKPHTMKKDDLAWIPIIGIQYDPKHFEEPEKFNPDRFCDESKKANYSSTFWSFGMGPRMCIGNRFALLEAKVLLFYIFARCQLKPCSKTTIPMKLSKKGFAMTAEDGFWFDIQPRSKTQFVVNSVSNGSVTR